MFHMFKYMANPEQKQAIQIIFGKPLMISTFCEVGEGFSILKKAIFDQIRSGISWVYAVAYIYECTIYKYNKVFGINL